MRYSFWHDRFGGPGRWSPSHNCPACTSCLIAVTAGSRPIEVVITLRVRLICGGDKAADCSGLRLERRRSLRPVGSHYFSEALPAWIALIRLPISVLPLRNRLEPWQFMWLMVGTIFFGCKWLTAWRAQKPNVHLELTPTLGYFFAWPEMDTEKFLAPKPSRARLDCFNKQPSLALPPTLV